MELMEHRINWNNLEKFKNVVKIVHKMSTLHIHIRCTDYIQSFSLWILHQSDVWGLILGVKSTGLLNCIQRCRDIS